MSFAAALVLSGCVPSLNPLYTEKDLVFDPALVGIWADAENADSDTWTFEKDGAKAYKLVINEKGDAREFEAHLFKLGTNLFLDFSPSDSLKEVRQEFIKACLLPAHLFAKVTQIEPALGFAFLDPEWLEKLLKENPQALRHEIIQQERLVLTASTQELQAFLLKQASDPKAFAKPGTLQRKQPKANLPPAKKSEP